jgi:hypothetical protein
VEKDLAKNRKGGIEERKARVETFLPSTSVKLKLRRRRGRRRKT